MTRRRTTTIPRAAAIALIALTLCCPLLFAGAAWSGQVRLHKGAGDGLSGVRLYAFTSAGAYTGQSALTDAQGLATFDSAVLGSGDTKFRADYRGYQFWSAPAPVVTETEIDFVIAHQSVPATVSSKHLGASESLGGVRVYAFTAAGAYVGLNATTDANGQVLFELPEQSYKFRADYMSRQYWTSAVTWEAASVSVPMATAEVSVSGMGQPLANVLVYVFTAGGSYLSRTARTGADGTVSFLLPAGDYKFRADIQGSQFWSDPATLAADQVAAVGVSAGGGIFTLTVGRDGQTPMAGIPCYVFSAAGSYLNRTAATNAAGQVSFPLADGEYKIRADYLGRQYWSDVYSVPGTLSGSVTIAHQAVTATVSSAFQGTVEPLSGVPVYVFTEAVQYMNMTAATDAAGQVSFDLPEQPYKFRADYMSRQYWSDAVTWTPAPITVALADAEVTVTGAGIPLPGVSVYAFMPSGAYLNRTAATDAEGKVIFRLPAGDTKFRADYQGSRFWSADTTLAADQATAAAISTGGGIFTFTVQQSADQPLAGLECYLFSESGAYLAKSATTDAAGTVTFSLSDGSFNIMVVFLGHQFWSGVFAVPETLAATLDIAHRDTVVTVTSSYPEQTPRAGLPVYLFTRSGSYLGQSRVTDADGHAVFSLPDQIYKMRVDDMGRQFWSPEFQFADVSVEIPRGAADVHVIRQGADVPGAVVYLFTEAGNYLGQNKVTDASGACRFVVTAGSYKFRVDHGGTQYWSAVTAIAADQAVTVPVDISPTGVTLTASPGTITAGQEAVLSWTTTRSESASIDNGIGDVPVTGSVTVSPADTTTYTITVTGPDGTATSSATVTVAPASILSVQIIDPDGIDDTGKDDYAIRWKGFFGDGATVSLYYDTDQAGFDGSLIAAGLTGTGDGMTVSTHAWNVSALPVGVYYVYAVVDDGLGNNARSYSVGPVTISRTDPVLPENHLIIDDSFSSWDWGTVAAINGDVAIVGAAGNYDEGIPGTVQIYRKTADVWAPGARLFKPTEAQQHEPLIELEVADSNGEVPQLVDWEYSSGKEALLDFESYPTDIDHLNFGRDYGEQLPEITIEKIEFLNGGIWEDHTWGWYPEGGGIAYNPNGNGWIWNGTFGRLAVPDEWYWAAGYRPTKIRVTFSVGQVQVLDESDFGAAVDISESYAVVGAPYDDETGAVYVYRLQDGEWTIDFRLVADDRGAWDDFGTEVAISGNRIAVGAPYAGSSESVTPGAIYIFERGDEGWVQTDKLPTPEDTAHFGHALDIQGDTLVAGTPFEGSELGSRVGAVYVFAHDGNGWTQQARFVSDNPMAWGYFGWSVALDGDAFIVSGYDDAYIYRFDGAQWGVETRVISPEEGNDFGTDVAIDGGYAVVGAYMDSTAEDYAGAAYVFRSKDGGWQPYSRITAGDAAADRYFGAAVGISGNSIVVTDWPDWPPQANAYFYSLPIPSLRLLEPDGIDDRADEDYYIHWVDSDIDDNARIALYYDLDNTGADGMLIVDGIAEDPDGYYDRYTWNTAGVPAGTYYVYAVISDGVNAPVTVYSPGPVVIDHTPLATVNGMQPLTGVGGDVLKLGRAVAIDGEAAVVGAEGRAFAYEYNGSAWVLAGELIPGGASPGPDYGLTVAIFGNRIIVGSPTDGEKGVDAGAVFMFARAEDGWFFQGKVTASDGKAGERFGTAIALHESFAVVGAPAVSIETGASSGSGAAYVFMNGEDGWAQVQKLTGDSSTRASFGRFVDISGQTMAVYSLGWDSVQFVTLYRLEGALWVASGKVNPGARITIGNWYGSYIALKDNDLFVLTNDDDYFYTVKKYTAGEGAWGLSQSFIPQPPRTIWLYGMAVAGPHIVTAGPGIATLYRTGESGWDRIAVFPEVGFGGSVDITDGWTVAGGSSWEDGRGKISFYPFNFAEMTADPAMIQPGGSATLSWNTTNAGTATIDNGIGSVSLSGSTVVTPAATTTYTLTATSALGTTTAAATVALPPPFVHFGAEPGVIPVNGTSVLTWQAVNADTVTIDQGIGAVDPSGSLTVAPEVNTTYTITASGPGGTATTFVRVKLPPTKVTFGADPENIQNGGSALLTWNAVNADACEITPGIGPVATSGSISVSPAENTTYTVTATGPGGSDTTEVLVRVDGTPPTVTGTDPADGSTVYLGADAMDLVITYADDNTGICSVQILDGEGSDITDEATPGDGQLSLHIEDPIEGEYRYTLVLTDCAGNRLERAISFNLASLSDIDNGIDFDEQQGGGGLIAGTVRLLNGNVVAARTDIAITSPHAHGLVLNAFYNSRSHRLGALGFGWTHSYEVSLVRIGAVDVKITDATGRSRLFKYDGDVYRGQMNEKTILTAEAGGYQWHLPDGLVYGFDADGRLDYIEDAAGNRLTMAYADSRLSTVTDTATGRALTFVYGEDLLSEIRGPQIPAMEEDVWVRFSYGGNRNLTSVSYADGSGFFYGYDDGADPNLNAIYDAQDHTLATWGYDGDDRCTSYFSPDGTGANAIDYVSADLVRITDAYDTIRDYTVSTVAGRARVTAMSGPAAGGYVNAPIVAWEYDDATMNLTAVTTARGTVHRYQNFDTRGNPGTVILAAGSEDERTIRFTYHPELSAPLTRTEESVLSSVESKVTIWDYDTDGNDTPNEAPGKLVRRYIENGFTYDNNASVTPYSYVTALTYNSHGQPLTVDGPRPGTADTTTYAYNATATATLISVTRPIVGTTTFAGHDAAGNVGSVTDVNERTTELEYDARGRLTLIRNLADGSMKNIYYNTAGLRETTIDEDGITQNFIYDDVYGRLDKIVDHRSNAIFHAYNDQGDLIQKSYLDPEGEMSSSRVYEYDGAIPGLLYREVNADSDHTFVEYRYDLDGNVSEVQDALLKTTIYQRDALGRVIRVQQQDGEGAIVTYYRYDRHGNLAAVTDGENHTTLYKYDDMGRLVRTQSPDTGTTTQAWDAAGNRVLRRDAEDQALTYDYDELNRLTQVTYPSPVDNILYSYDGGTDGKGHLTGMMDPSGSTGFMYDARGRLKEKTFTREGISLTLSRQFTLAGRQSSLTYPSGRVLTFERRDCACGVDGIFTHVGATEPVTLMDNLVYRPFGSATATDTGSGDTIANQHDADGRLVTTNPGSPREQQITYDANGNLKSVSNPRRPWENVAYQYDDIGRLTKAVGPYGLINYGYDKAGNRTSRYTTLGDSRYDIYHYESGTNRISSVNDVYGSDSRTFAHDARGNMTLYDGMSLSYNADNRLISVTEEGATIATYTYNGFGQRISKNVTATDETTVFLWDFDGNIVAEYDGTGALKAEYLYRGANRLAMADAAGEVYFYQNDRLGTPIAITDKNNNAVWEATYLPFGEAMVNPNSTVENNFRFPGQYYDAETGLHYNYHRYYDPRVGRYVSSDPIGLSGGINLYIYSKNNSIKYVDPRGLEVFAVNDLIETGFVDRPPDYYSLTISLPIPNPKTGSFIGWSGQAQIDSYGRFYYSTVGSSYGSQSIIPAFSIAGGWLDDCEPPTKEKLKKFLEGGSLSLSVGAGPGFGYTFVPQVGRAVETGFYTPQYGLTQNYSYREERLDVK